MVERSTKRKREEAGITTTTTTTTTAATQGTLPHRTRSTCTTLPSLTRHQLQRQHPQQQSLPKKARLCLAADDGHETRPVRVVSQSAALDLCTPLHPLLHSPTGQYTTFHTGLASRCHVCQRQSHPTRMGLGVGGGLASGRGGGGESGGTVAGWTGGASLLAMSLTCASCTQPTCHVCMRECGACEQYICSRCCVDKEDVVCFACLETLDECDDGDGNGDSNGDGNGDGDVDWSRRGHGNRGSDENGRAWPSRPR